MGLMKDRVCVCVCVCVFTKQKSPLHFSVTANTAAGFGIMCLSCLLVTFKLLKAKILFLLKFNAPKYYENYAYSNSIQYVTFLASKV